MDASRLDRRIDLYHRVLSSNNAGEHVPTWPESYATVWTEALDVSGRELVAAGAMTAEHTMRFRIRWRGDVLWTDRINFEGVDYNISNLAEIGRRDGLDILATAVVL